MWRFVPQRKYEPKYVIKIILQQLLIIVNVRKNRRSVSIEVNLISPYMPMATYPCILHISI